VGVEKPFSRDFANEIRSQIIESWFAVGAEIHRNYCFGSFFKATPGYVNSVQRFTLFEPGDYDPPEYRNLWLNLEGL